MTCQRPPGLGPRQSLKAPLQQRQRSPITALRLGCLSDSSMSLSLTVSDARLGLPVTRPGAWQSAAEIARLTSAGDSESSCPGRAPSRRKSAAGRRRPPTTPTVAVTSNWPGAGADRSSQWSQVAEVACRPPPGSRRRWSFGAPSTPGPARGTVT